MELVIATDDFRINGFSYPGFPLVLDNNMEVVAEVTDYLINKCIVRGRVSSRHGWKAYGQSLYDYFSFIEANDDWHWKHVDLTGGTTVVSAYRDWSVTTLGLKPSTINYRLRIIADFYRYAYRRGWIDRLPFDLERVFVRRNSSFLIHTRSANRTVVSPNVMLKSQPPVIRVLNIDQIKQFLAAVRNPTQHLMAKLALQTGLRKEELVTFPVAYIQNPHAQPRVAAHSVVALDPADMKTKGSRPRSIHVPFKLMSDLWQYTIHERHQLESLADRKHTVLFLNRDGQPYANAGGSLNKLWSGLGLPFKVTPHMLRHTYATHTLYSLKRLLALRVDPLMYVRDRLGHKSLLTTQKYLHFLDDIEDDLMSHFQDEIDQISIG